MQKNNRHTVAASDGPLRFLLQNGNRRKYYHQFVAVNPANWDVVSFGPNSNDVLAEAHRKGVSSPSIIFVSE